MTQETQNTSSNQVGNKGAKPEPEDLEVHPTPPHRIYKGKTFLHPDETIEDLAVKHESDISVGTTNIGAKPSKDPVADV